MAVKNTEPKQETKVEKTTEAPAKPQAVKEKAAFYVYIGPSIRGLISRNAIYEVNELKSLDRALEKHPDIKHLLIPGEQLGQARIAIKDADSFLSTIYNRLANKA